jgi:hypothetical protein
VKNKFAALESLQDNGDSRSWDTIKKSIQILAKQNIGHFELKHHKPWFDEEFSKLVDRRKHAKLMWFQEPSEGNEDNFESCSAGR